MSGPDIPANRPQCNELVYEHLNRWPSGFLAQYFVAISSIVHLLNAGGLANVK